MWPHTGVNKVVLQIRKKGFSGHTPAPLRTVWLPGKFSLCLFFTVPECLRCSACWAVLVLWVVDSAFRGLEIRAPVTLVPRELCPRPRWSAQQSCSHPVWSPRGEPLPSPPILLWEVTSPAIHSYHSFPKSYVLFCFSFLKSFCFVLLSFSRAILHSVCNPMDCGVPGFPGLHHLPELCSNSCPGACSYFALRGSQLTLLWWFPWTGKGLSLHIHVSILPHSGGHITRSRIPYAVPYSTWFFFFFRFKTKPCSDLFVLLYFREAVYCDFIYFQMFSGKWI